MVRPVTGDVRPTEEPDGGTRLELEHTGNDDEHWKRYVTGVGWDISFLRLDTHRSGVPLQPEDEWAATEQGIEFMAASSRQWCAAGIDPAEAAAARTTAFYTSS